MCVCYHSPLKTCIASCCIVGSWTCGCDPSSYEFCSTCSEDPKARVELGEDAPREGMRYGGKGYKFDHYSYRPSFAVFNSRRSHDTTCCTRSLDNLPRSAAPRARKSEPREHARTAKPQQHSTRNSQHRPSTCTTKSEDTHELRATTTRPGAHVP